LVPFASAVQWCSIENSSAQIVMYYVAFFDVTYLVADDIDGGIVVALAALPTPLLLPVRNGKGQNHPSECEAHFLLPHYFSSTAKANQAEGSGVAAAAEMGRSFTTLTRQGN
jgi:hypothetical protein